MSTTVLHPQSVAPRAPARSGADWTTSEPAPSSTALAASLSPEVEKPMGRLMYSENNKWTIRNYAGRRVFNEVGESTRFVVPGELVILDRSRRADGRLPDLEIHENPARRKRKGLAPKWLEEPRLVKAVLVAFALGGWAVWTAITLWMLII